MRPTYLSGGTWCVAGVRAVVEGAVDWEGCGGGVVFPVSLRLAIPLDSGLGARHEVVGGISTIGELRVVCVLSSLRSNLFHNSNAR